jgi:hypothetical protein
LGDVSTGDRLIDDLEEAKGKADDRITPMTTPVMSKTVKLRARRMAFSRSAVGGGN